MKPFELKKPDTERIIQRENERVRIENEKIEIKNKLLEAANDLLEMPMDQLVRKYTACGLHSMVERSVKNPECHYNFKWREIDGKTVLVLSESMIRAFYVIKNYMSRAHEKYGFDFLDAKECSDGWWKMNVKNEFQSYLAGYLGFKKCSGDEDDGNVEYTFWGDVLT